jgi:multisubunit Na+/H+ antiporter MnhB subunit
MNKAEIVQICQNALSMENSLLLAYRGIFLTIEAVALGIAAVLIELRTALRAPQLVLVVVFGIGFVITMLWIYQVPKRTPIVDGWKCRIYQETRGTELSKDFEHYGHVGLHWRSIRLTLDIVAPLIVIILWLVVLLVAVG